MRTLDDGSAINAFIDDFAEMMSVVWEYGTRVQIAKAADNESAVADTAYKHWVQAIKPQLVLAENNLQKKLLTSTALGTLPDNRFGPLIKRWQTVERLFRSENVPLHTRLSTIATDYDKLIGAIEIELNGQLYTPPQLAKKLECPERSERERAWTLEAEQRLAIRSQIDTLFDEQLGLREQVAHNAGHADYLDWEWHNKCRFDYTRSDCAAFATAIEEVCVPIIRQLNDERVASLQVETLRPWDTQINPQGRSRLEPFAADDAQGLVDGCSKIFEQVGCGLAEDFAGMKMGRNMDLVSRRGKRAGGFQASLQEVREPFIFMNTAGRQEDVVVMLHEIGHALHYMWASRSDNNGFVHGAPIEFCEVASMSLELIGMPEVGVFYDGDEAQVRQARRSHLEKILRLFPWMAAIDQFQHWLYEYPGHSVRQRDEAWLALMHRFGSRHGGVDVDWSGIEDQLACYWQRQIHLLHHPLYYIEYGIAQLGALQLWLRYRNDPKQTLSDYRAALSLGGRRPLPELFNAAGLDLDFSKATLEPLIAEVVAERDRLA